MIQSGILAARPSFTPTRYDGLPVQLYNGGTALRKSWPDRRTASVNAFFFSGRLQVVVNPEQHVDHYDDAVIFESQPERVSFSWPAGAGHAHPEFQPSRGSADQPVSLGHPLTFCRTPGACIARAMLPRSTATATISAGLIRLTVFLVSLHAARRVCNRRRGIRPLRAQFTWRDPAIPTSLS
jgi:hypothetical protein